MAAEECVNSLDVAPLAGSYQLFFTNLRARRKLSCHHFLFSLLKNTAELPTWSTLPPFRMSRHRRTNKREANWKHGCCQLFKPEDVQN